jgi:deoxyhypusine synthase
MDRLYEVIVWRDEHNILEMRIVSVEQKIVEIKEELLKLAA